MMMNRALYAAFLLPTVHAWTFLSTNSSGKADILEESGTLNCTKIHQAKGERFTWDPEKSNLCISIFTDDNCQNRAGISCPFWKKDASQDFGSIEVYTDKQAATATIATATVTASESSSSSTSESTSSTSSSTSSTSSSSPSTAPTSSSTNGASSSSGSDSGLSGGAIAGIVIGAIAGISIIAAIFFLFGRRRRNNSAAAANQQAGSAYPDKYVPPDTATTYSATSPITGFGPGKQPPSSSGASVHSPLGTTVSELHDQARPAELISSPISELDAQQDHKSYFVRS